MCGQFGKTGGLSSVARVAYMKNFTYDRRRELPLSFSGIFDFHACFVSACGEVFPGGRAHGQAEKIRTQKEADSVFGRDTALCGFCGDDFDFFEGFRVSERHGSSDWRRTYRAYFFY